ncbi:MAG: carbon-nitrogen hydrolase family protein [Rhodobacteraceae bacterium]|nr:carbon-nitrogen hydrolase family protein [Paracoccaceae bacterium]
MKTALLQLSVTDDPAENLSVTVPMIREAAAAGAGFILTPEVTNCLSSDRAHQNAVLRPEAEDATLAALRAEAVRAHVWVLIGSLALKTRDPDGRFANRSFMIAPDGKIVARYDKIHMFDVNVSETETYRESAGYRPGETAVLAETPFARVGMSICYDVRFPLLYRHLAREGANCLTIPAAFNDTTGAAHWHPLLRARAIENTSYVLAPAQTGTHAMHDGRPRRTYGHSLAVSPWGEVLLDMGEGVGIGHVELRRSEVDKARQRVPSLTHDRDFEGP